MIPPLNPNWPDQARCAEMGDDMFVEGKDQKRARSICVGCPVRVECLSEALDSRIEWGVWGGLTERERRQLLRQRPDVESWYTVLMADAMAAAEATKSDDEPSRVIFGPRSRRAS